MTKEGLGGDDQPTAVFPVPTLLLAFVAARFEIKIEGAAMMQIAIRTLSKPPNGKTKPKVAPPATSSPNCD